MKFGINCISLCSAICSVVILFMRCRNTLKNLRFRSEDISLIILFLQKLQLCTAHLLKPRYIELNLENYSRILLVSHFSTLLTDLMKYRHCLELLDVFFVVCFVASQHLK